YLHKNNRNDKKFNMGPIIGWVDQADCRHK
ncbi:TPA: phosphodiester glycosidase family protein, partial [Acinetobacter baumannii]